MTQNLGLSGKKQDPSCLRYNVKFPQFYKMLISSANADKTTSAWFIYHGITVFDWTTNWTELNLIEDLWFSLEVKMKYSKHLKVHTSLISSVPPHINGVIHAKGESARYIPITYKLFSRMTFSLWSAVSYNIWICVKQLDYIYFNSCFNSVNFHW